MRTILNNENILLNGLGEPLIDGCNYHTKWQRVRSMRFVLKGVSGDKANLVTRGTKRDFWTDIDDLIFIKSHVNIQKELMEKVPKQISITRMCLDTYLHTGEVLKKSVVITLTEEQRQQIFNKSKGIRPIFLGATITE